MIEYNLKNYFDKKFLGSDLSGQSIGEEVAGLIKHFEKMASRLKSGSRVKVFAVSHSGVIEYFTKLAYLNAHPEKNPKEVRAEEVGGILGYMEGPAIEIRTDAKGEAEMEIKFKDLELKL